MAIVSTDQARFFFRGVDSNSMKVYLLELPTRPTPAARGKSEDVPGMDGKLFLPEGTYDRINVTTKLEMGDGADIDQVNAWLTGEGDLVFMDEPNRAYHARIVKGSDRSHRGNRVWNRNWKQTWDCEPFRYESAPTQLPAITASGTKITNPGTIESLPLIRVSGSGDGTLMIGTATMLFDGIASPVTIDCEAKIAYTGAGTAASPRVLATQHVTGEWITIAPGDNFVTFTGGISKVEITPRWRWL